MNKNKFQLWNRILAIVSLLVFVFVLTLTGVFSYTRAGVHVGAPERVQAATSSNLNFQARLYGNNGNTVPDGYYNIQFKLYDAASNGNNLWTETWYDSNGASSGNDNRVRVVNGYMSVQLGSLTAFPSMNWDQDLWISLNVGGSTHTSTPTYDGEMSPRIKLTAVPYAFQSQRAEQLNHDQGTYSGDLAFDTLTANRSFLLPDTSLATTGSPGTLCVFNGSLSNCPAATGSAFYVQNTGGLLTPQSEANFNIQATNSGTDGTIGGIIRGASGGQTVDLLQLQASDGAVLTAFEADGTLRFGADTNLYRDGADQLKTDDALDVVGALTQNGVAVCLASGNCVGVGGSGDILHNGNSFDEDLVIGTNDNYNLQLETNGSTVATFTTAGQLQLPTTGSGGGLLIGGDANLYRSAADALATDDAFTVAGLLTANGDLTLQTGDTFTMNGDAFTDLTGTGLTITGGALTVDNTALDDNFFIQGGNSFGTAAILGTNDNQSLQFETNNSAAMTILANGNVGIGTDNPGAKLEVDGNIKVGTNIIYAGDANASLNLSTGAWSRYNGGQSIVDANSGTVLARFTKSTTSLPANLDSAAVLQANSVVARELTGSAGSGGVGEDIVVKGGDSITAPQYAGGHGGNVVIQGGRATDDSQGNGGTPGYVAFNTYDFGASTATERMRISYGGNIGIGDSDPSTLLSLGGTGSANGLTLGDDAADPVNLYRDGANQLKTDDALDVVGALTQNGVAVCLTSGNCIGVGGAGDVLQGGNSFTTDMTIGTNDNFDLNLETNGSTVATFTTAGQLQLPTTGSGGGILFGGDANLYRSAASTLATDDAFTIAGLLTANGDITLQTGDTFTMNGDTFTDLTGTGLTITGGALTVDNTALDDSFFIQGGNSFGTAAILGTNDNQSLQFETNNATAMTILASGNVGIGTASPDSRLHVYGAATIQSDVATNDLSPLTSNNLGNPQLSVVNRAASGSYGGVHVYTGGANSGTFLTSNGGSIGRWSAGASFFSGNNWRASETTGSALVQNSGSLTYSVNASQTIGTVASMTELFRITSSGNVGINDTNPSTLLSLGGTGSANGITLGDDAANSVNLYRSAADTLATDDAFTIAGLLTANGDLTLQTGDTFTMNGDAFTDLTGDGLQASANALTLAIQADKGLEVDSDGLSLIDCTDGQILKYNGSNQWVCAADAGGTGVGDDVLVNGVDADGANFLDTTASATEAATSWALDPQSPDEISLSIGAASATDAGILTAGAQTLGGDKTFNDALTVTGLLTANGNLTLQTGDTFTINGDALTDLTGTGLTNTGGALTVDNTVLDNSFFIQGGNSFGTTAIFGTNDNQSLQFETNGSPAMTILANGNVGIGTATPEAKFHVAGGNIQLDFNQALIGERSTGAVYYNLASVGSSNSVFLGDANTDTRVNAGSYLHLQTNNTIRWSLYNTQFRPATDNTGQIGTPTRRIANGYFGTGGVSIGSGATPPSSGLVVDGSVGIGDTDPSTLLSLGGTGSTNGITLGDDAANSVNLYRSAADTLATDDAFTVAGLLTANGDITLQTGDTFTMNGDAFTDLTGTGLTITGGALTVDNTVLDDSFFLQGGNSFGVAATLGTNDAFGLNLEVNNATVASFSSTGAALFQNSTDSTTAFQIQDANGDAFFVADSTNNHIEVGNDTASGSILTVRGASNSEGLYLASPSGNSPILKFDNGTEQFGIRSTSTELHLGHYDGSYRPTVSLSNTGQVTFKNTANSTTAFQVQSTTSHNVLVVNTTNRRVGVGLGVGEAPANGVLTVGTDTTIASGGMYFGTDTNLYRSAANILQTDDSFTVGGAQFTNNGSTLNTALSLSDFATGGAVGTAAATVDTATSLSIAQTTAGQTLSLPDPTDDTAGRVIYVLNTGSVSFNMHSVTIPAGYGQIYVWNGSSWILGASGGSAGGSTVTLQSAYDGGNALTTSNARDIDFTLANTATDANFTIDIASGSTGEFQIEAAGTDVLQIGAAGQLQLDVQGSTGGILLGGDANLYRSAADTLATDGDLSVGSTIYTDWLDVENSVDVGGSIFSEGNINSTRTSSSMNAFLAWVDGDTSPRWQVNADGTTLWGDGTNALDTELYRASADLLSLGDGDDFQVTNASGEHIRLSADSNAAFISVENDYYGDWLLSSEVTGDAEYRFQIDTDGYIQWGDGANALDTTLYRSGAGVLRTDGALDVRNYINIQSDNGELLTLNDSSGTNQAYIQLQVDGTDMWEIGTEAAGEFFIYNDQTSSKALMIQSGGMVVTGGDLGVSDDLFVDDRLEVGNNLMVDTNDGGAPLTFGSAADTNLYRGGSNLLQTDDALTVAGLLTANGNLTLQTGDTFTMNGDALTDLTGTGLTVVSGALTVDASAFGGDFFAQGGNSFGAAATIGTNDNFGLNFETNGSTVSSLSATGQALFKNSTNSTTAFQVQNTSGNSLLGVDTTNNQVVLGASSSVDGKLVFRNSGGSNTVGLTLAANPGTSYTLKLPTTNPVSGQCIKTSASDPNQLVFGSCVTPTTPQFVQQAANNGSTSSLNINISSSVQGNLLIAMISVNSGSAIVSSVTDNGSNTWTKATSGSGNGQDMEIWYAENASPATQVTVNLSSSDQIGVNVSEFAGMAASNVLDDSDGSTGTGTSHGTPTITSTVGHDLIIAGISYQSGPTVSSSDSGWNTLTPVSSNGYMQSRFQELDTAGNIDADWTSSYWTRSSTAIAAFKPAGDGADYAEVYGTTDASIEPGDLVALDTSKPATIVEEGHTKAWVTKTTLDNRNNLLGVVSTNPGKLIGESLFSTADNPRPIALNGRVPVKVSTENGPIEPGDYLAPSSIPGVAMKATEPGMTIGQAMSGFNGQGQGVVTVFIKSTYYPGDASQSDDNELFNLQSSDISVANLNTAGRINLGELNVDGYQSVFIKEYGDAGSEKLQMHGAKGFNFTTGDEAKNEVVSIDEDGHVVFKNVTDSETAFLVQDAGGDDVFSVNTKDGSTNVENNLNVNGDATIQGTVYTDSIDSASGLALNGGAGGVRINGGVGPDSLSLSSEGFATFKTASNSAAAFQIQNASGTSLFQVDSQNNRIYIGNSTPDDIGTILVLDNKNTEGDPVGVAGAMYFNSSASSFRCHDGTGWFNCGRAPNTGYFSDNVGYDLDDSKISLWDDDEDYPNITLDNSTDSVVISISIAGTGKGNDTEYNLFTIHRDVDGNPDCEDEQVGIAFGGFTSNDGAPLLASGTFRDSPGEKGNVRYVVCHDGTKAFSSNGSDAINNRVGDITFTLEESRP